MCKYLLVSLYLLCTSWHHKLLTNNRRTVSVAFIFPKIDVASSFWICQYFPNSYFSGSSHSASQHTLTCSCLDDEQRWGQSLITHLPSPGSHRPGAPLPVPPASSCPGMFCDSQEYATAFLQEGTVPNLCCSHLYGINKCLLSMRKSTRMNLPLYSHGYNWQACAWGGGIWDVLQGKGLEHSLSPVPRGTLWPHCPWVTRDLFLSSTWCLAMPWKEGQLLQEKRECPKSHLSVCYSLGRWKTLT